MPKKPPRDNQRNRAPRTVQSAASVLHRIARRSLTDVYVDNQLVETLRSRLPVAVRGHVLRVIDKPQELVIFADSAAWAARLRLLLVQDPALVSGRSATVKVLPLGAAG